MDIYEKVLKKQCIEKSQIEKAFRCIPLQAETSMNKLQTQINLLTQRQKETSKLLTKALKEMRIIEEYKQECFIGTNNKQNII